MSSGAYALLGALLGGILTGSSALGVEAFRWRRDQHEREDKAQRRLREAARLVAYELDGIALSLRLILAEDEGAEVDLGEYATPIWDEYRPVLAYHVNPGPSWSAIEAGIFYVSLMRDFVLENGPRRLRVGGQLTRQAASSLEKVEQAVEVLRGL